MSRQINNNKIISDVTRRQNRLSRNGRSNMRKRRWKTKWLCYIKTEGFAKLLQNITKSFWSSSDVRGVGCETCYTQWIWGSCPTTSHQVSLLFNESDFLAPLFPVWLFSDRFNIVFAESFVPTVTRRTWRVWWAFFMMSSRRFVILMVYCALTLRNSNFITS